jgi:hypothetical protein
MRGIAGREPNTGEDGPLKSQISLRTGLPGLAYRASANSDMIAIEPSVL